MAGPVPPALYTGWSIQSGTYMHYVAIEQFQKRLDHCSEGWSCRTQCSIRQPFTAMIKANRLMCHLHGRRS